MVLCDTNILIHFFNGNAETSEKLDQIGFENVLLSSVTIMELIQGMTNKLELNQMKKVLKYYDVLHFDQEISEKAIQLIDNYKLSHNLQIPDAIIGATALVHNIPLFTYYLKDFQFMPNLSLVPN
jgi:predicted nucleic acid-binding protein